MEDKALPKSYGEEVAPPLSFTEQNELCKRLDEFYQTSGPQLKFQPSSLFRGAMYAMRYKENPDWMAQVAHSLREILYQFKGGGRRRDAFVDYGSTYDKNKIDQDVGTYYNFISDIAHHRFERAGMSLLVGGTKNKPIIITVEVFENVVLKFGGILFAVLRDKLMRIKKLMIFLHWGRHRSTLRRNRTHKFLNYD